MRALVFGLWLLTELCADAAYAKTLGKKVKLAQLDSDPTTAAACSEQSLIGKRLPAESLALLQTFRNGRWQDPEEGRSSPVRQSAHVLVLHFWAPWCEPCKSELPTLAQFQERLSRRYGSGIQFLYIAHQTPAPQLAEFIASLSTPGHRETPPAGTPATNPPTDERSQALRKLFSIGEQYYDPEWRIWKSVAGRCKETKLPVTMVVTPDLLIRNVSVGPIVDLLAFLRPIEDFLGFY